MVSISSRFTRDFGLDEARALVNAARSCQAPMSMSQIRVLGGANAHVPVDATAFGHRKHRFMVTFLAMYGGGPEVVAAQERWVSESVAAVAPISEGTYVNFLGQGQAKATIAYSEATLARLRAVKRRYDPDNVLRLNTNFVPA
jgi:FAD/FMN-containing dehydrogenase